MNWLKNLFSGDKSTSVKEEKYTTDDPQVRYVRDTLDFAKKQRNDLRQKYKEKQDWEHQYGRLQVDELKKFTGIEFEKYLAGLFKNHGYRVEMTALTGDFGADLILFKDQQRIAVQAKCYSGSVGVSAVQEALSGMAYYQCHLAWVVTTGNYTNNAIELAKQSRVRLIGQRELGQFIMQARNKPQY